MIRFACQCGHRFVLEDSEAAREVQCPDCRKLNDVPTLAELAHLDDDGTLNLKPLEIKEDPDRLAVLSKVYAKGRQDETGNDIDFRQTPEEIASRGAPAAPGGRDPEQVVRPRYDPETGQLIRPIDVAPTPPRMAIPVKPPALQYANRSTLRTDTLSATNLAKPVNIFVMFCAAVLMFLAGLIAILAILHFWFLIAPAVFFELIVIAHYGVTIEELGPQGNDELPRLFREVQFYEDVFSPLQSILVALILCYAPVIVCFNLPIAPILAVGLGVLAAGGGTYLFPAVILTLITSGTISNLRPDRLLGTITACGTSYVWAIASWMCAGAVFLWAFLRFIAPLLGQAQPYLAMLPASMTMVLALPMTQVLTVPFAHVFAWQTGMLYRRHYDAFPWVGQRFEKKLAVAKKV